MEDLELAQALIVVSDLTVKTRAYWSGLSPDQLPERDASMIAMRQAEALRGSLQRWIGTRAMRAAMTASSK